MIDFNPLIPTFSLSEKEIFGFEVPLIKGKDQTRRVL
jgi:hypothetical protein